ncbi:MAG: 1-acyl-sn-glycerol-3-phosphate acyltransferase [Planctomycetaceae bacterium]|nr:1-acyl-sn-glycerol-3-phosphate acyltransferase [Planctomycetaceae bacterium]
MAWKSYYLAAGVISTVALPFFDGVENAGNLPDGPCIVAANHSSFLDGPLLALAYCRVRLKPLHMIAYEEPFHHPLMGWILRSGGAIPFRRGDRASQAKMLATALGWMKAGEAVGIFPEGHINPRPRMNRARPGAALLALETRLPIIPTAIIGSSEVMPPGKRLPRLGPRVKVHFGRPVPLMDKEYLYRRLPKDERAQMIKNLGHRIVRAIGMLSGREVKE